MEFFSERGFLEDFQGSREGVGAKKQAQAEDVIDLGNSTFWKEVRHEILLPLAGFHDAVSSRWSGLSSTPQYRGDPLGEGDQHRPLGGLFRGHAVLQRTRFCGFV